MNDKPYKQEESYLKNLENISSEKELRSLIPNYPKVLDKRIQKSLDYFSLEFIQESNIAFQTLLMFSFEIKFFY